MLAKPERFIDGSDVALCGRGFLLLPLKTLDNNCMKLCTFMLKIGAIEFDIGLGLIELNGSEGP